MTSPTDRRKFYNPMYPCAECELGLALRDGGLCRDCLGEKRTYLPSPEEIAEATAEIRKTWTAEDHVKHLPPPREKPVYKAHIR